MATAVPTPSTRPRFRTDLVAEPIEEEGQRYVDVIDPDTGSAFRFYEVEYSIACAMDGERDITGLVEWAREELGVAPTSAELSTVIATLGDLGYIDAAEAIAEPAPAESPFDLAAAGARGRPAPAPIMPPAQVQVEDVELGFSEQAPRKPSMPAATVAAADVELGHMAPSRPAPARGPAVPITELGPAGARPGAKTPLSPLSPEDQFAGSTDVQGNVVEFDALTPPPPSEEFISTRPVLRPLSRADADDDGPTNLPRPQVGDFDDDEVSVDLTDHVPLRPDDVKEAVRQSKVMKAVEVPPELMGQLDEREKQIAAAAEAAKQAARTRAASDAGARQLEEPTKPIERIQRAEAIPVPDSGPTVRGEARSDVRPSAEARPVELPAPVGVSRPKSKSIPVPTRPSEQQIATPVAPVAPQTSRTWPILLILLVLAIVAVAAFFVWKLVFDKPVTTAEPAPAPTPVEPAPAPAVEPAPTPAPPPEAPKPSATLALTEGPPAEVKVPATGIVGFSVAVGTEVKPDDTLVKLGGYQRFEAKLGDGKTGGLLWDIEKRVPKEIEGHNAQAAKAREGGNEALAKQFEKKVVERTARLEQKKREAATLQDAIAKFIVKAPTGGTVKTVVAPGKRVKEGDVVVRLEGAKALTATFAAGDKPFTAGAAVKVASKAAPDQKVDCTVAEVKGSDVVVSCPEGSAVPAGTEVVLE